jgi:methylation protein EvaC
MRSHFEDLLDDIIEERGGQTGFNLLEIGSNDGTFLDFCKGVAKSATGFEPAKNLADRADKKGVKTISRLFDCDSAAFLASTKYRADVIVARHVFCHVDYWEGFIRGLELVSHENTLIFIEVPYVGDMLKMNSFDQVYHEHLSYMSFTAMRKLLEKTSLRVHRVIHYGIHGGAVGIMLRHRAHKAPEHSSITEYTVKETPQKLHADWIEMANRASERRTNLWELLTELRMRGEKVCGFGASAKATVWINACGLTKKDIAFVCDSTAEKQGCLVPGTDILVVSETELMKADYAINFSWNFHKEISEKRKAFTDKGGKWIQVVPEVKVLL